MLGIRIGKSANYRHFNEENLEIIIEIEGLECWTTLTDTFWVDCPEIRVSKDKSGNNILSDWIKVNNLMPPEESREKKGRKDIIILEVIEPYKKYRLYKTNL